MKILFDIGHPAHVHLFKNLIFYFKKKGHKIIVVSRDKDITVYLLDHYKISHTVISKAKSGSIGSLYEFFERTIKIIRLQRKNRFDIAIGTSSSISYLSLFFRVKSYVFSDNDDLFSFQFALLAYPFATKILNPDYMKPIFVKKKRVLYPSYQKLAYLHPEIFTPNKNVLKKYNLEPYKYIVIRLSALKAYHDRNAVSLTLLLYKIKKIVKKYPIILSQENKQSTINPLALHDIVAFSKFVLTDSHTLSTEAACLGRPSILYTNFKNKLSYTDELQDKYSLIDIFSKNETNLMLKTIKKIHHDSNNNISLNIKDNWLKMIKEKVNLNKWMINYFNNEIHCL